MIFFFLRMVECEVVVDDFVRIGRIGRRNVFFDVFVVGYVNVIIVGFFEVLENFFISFLI